MLLFALAIAPLFAQGGGNCSDANIGSAIVTMAVSGETILIPAQAGVSVHICHISIAWTSGVNVTLEKVSSGGTYTPLSGTYPNINNMSEYFGGSLVTGLGYGFSINLGASVSGGGVVTYFISRTS